MKKIVAAALAACALLACGGISKAENYPARPITMIVPFPAGGATDTLARFLGQHMTEFLGQNVVIENVGGAAGRIAVQKAVRSAPDGYTLSIGTSTTHMLTGGLYQLPYDLLADLDPIVLIGSGHDRFRDRQGFYHGLILPIAEHRWPKDVRSGAVDRHQPGERGSTCMGQFDEQAAPVVGIGNAANEAERLQPVDPLGDARQRHEEIMFECSRRDAMGRPHAVQRIEQEHVARGQPLPCGGLRHMPLHAAG